MATAVPLRMIIFLKWGTHNVTRLLDHRKPGFQLAPQCPPVLDVCVRLLWLLVFFMA